MKLFLVVIVLLSVVLTDGAQPKKCFNKVAGYCRKKCMIGEISETGCLHAKLCCVKEEENKRKLLELQTTAQPNKKTEVLMDYAILPTITYATISL